MTDGPLIVQSDKTLLLEVDHELAEACRRAIAPFAELERSPEHVHTYRITPLGLERAGRRPRRRAGRQRPATFSRYSVPHALLVDVAETMARYGGLKLLKHPVHGLVLEATDRPVLEGSSARPRCGRSSASGSTPTRWSCTPASAAPSSRYSQAGLAR